MGYSDLFSLESDWDICQIDHIRCLLLCEDMPRAVGRQRAWMDAKTDKSDSRFVIPRGVALLLPHGLEDSLVSKYSLRFDSQLITYALDENGTLHLYKWHGRGTGTKVHSHLISRNLKHDWSPLLPIWTQNAECNLTGIVLNISIIDSFPNVFRDAGQYFGRDRDIFAALKDTLGFQLA